ncbi:hypothetical protein [Kibdelosporangium philippinense]|uniref:hypothetical protein n=1 Tax=Kibdelosporangium philippinense TaxID=211113 RepID=UPI00361F0798
MDELTAPPEGQALPEGANMSCYTGQFEKYEGLTVNFDEPCTPLAARSSTKPAAHLDTPQAKAGWTSSSRASRTHLPAEGITSRKRTAAARSKP